MKTFLPAATTALAALLAGCTTIETAPMSDALATQIRGQTVAVVVEEPSTFAVVLTPAVGLGPLGIPEMVEEGRRLVSENHIVDPADGVAMVLGDSTSSSATCSASEGQPAAAPSCAAANVQVWSMVPSLPSSTVMTTLPAATVVTMVARGRTTVQAPDTSAPSAS